jgi:GT2 family glycosyltransferase
MLKNKEIPSLSIIIPTWNTAEITLHCVESIIKHLGQLVEIIVVDNGSTDNTQEVFQKTVIKYLKLDKNYGYATACNAGTKVATSDYFLFLNSDMELIDSQVLTMIDFYKNNRGCGLIGPKLLNPDLSPQGSVFPPQTPLNAFKEFWLSKNTYSKYLPKATKPEKVWAISGGAVLISKENYYLVGGWNQHYHMYYEDLDLCRQISNRGLSIYYFPACRFIHRHGASGVNLANSNNQWRRLITSSKIYHGLLKHYLINLIIWSGQKWQKKFLNI